MHQKKRNKHCAVCIYGNNVDLIGHYAMLPLAFYAKNQAGLLLGGVYAFFKLGWLEIDLVWVQENVRRQGIATPVTEAN